MPSIKGLRSRGRPAQWESGERRKLGTRPFDPVGALKPDYRKKVREDQCSSDSQSVPVKR